MAPNSLQSILEGLIDRIAAAIAAKARPGRAAAPARAAARPAGGKSGGRICPAPGCGEPGAGPRNRWFCRPHSASLSVTEQKRLLAQAGAKRSAKATPSAARKAGRRGARKLNMNCRVAGCPNVSRGPRFGFICDKHRRDLSKAEQKAAREKYNARRAA